jgi:serine/threonine protein kinase/Leucine-rich repeat (LRR) protein
LLVRHIEIAAALRSFFAAEEPLRKMAVTKISEESAGISTRSIAAQGQETVPPKPNADRPLGTIGSGLAGQFGRYQIVRALGKGAMGAVYLALDTQLKRNVAIKTPHFEDDATGELLQRFYREAEAAATLLNANICPVYDVGEIDGKHFISMAYIEGRPLSDLIRGDKLQNERHIVIAVHKLARALQQAHDRGIVHRDLKPANIMVNKQGEPIIMDFGLARKRRAEGEATLTQSGVILGSPAYMSPEQIEGNPDSVGPASDQYSLGVVLYEMLTRQLPFRGSVVNVLAQILTKDLTRPSELRPGLDSRIEAVCLRMMSKKVSDRFPSMKAVAEELYAILKSTVAEPIAGEKSPTASRSPAALAPSRGDAGASQIRKSIKQKVLTESDVISLEELVRKCLRRHDYDQMIQIIERIPEERRNAALRAFLEKAREKTDEISFLICEIDEADRLEDAPTALKKAEDLLKLKPGHHRAREIQEKFSGYGEGGVARIGPLWQFTQPWNEGGWIPWSVLAFGLAVFAVMFGVMVIYLNKTAILIDIKDQGVEVAVKGTTLIVTGPDKQSVKVEPGEQELTITAAGLEMSTRSFSLKRGEKRTVTVSIVNKEIVARLENEILPLARVGDDGGQHNKFAQQGRNVAPKQLAPDTDGFVPLFNGKDLTGWIVDSGDKNAWSVNDRGELVAHAPDKENFPDQVYLLSERTFVDFRLRFQFLGLGENAMSGVAIRGVLHETAGMSYPDALNSDWPYHLTALLGTYQGSDATGVLWWSPNSKGVLPLMVDRIAHLKPPGEWNDAEFEMRGQSLRIAINGRDVLKVMLDKTRPSAFPAPALNRYSGRIGFLKRNGEFRFRKIEIKELTSQTASTQPTEGFVPLFNGKDLMGWQKIHSDTIDWTFEDGVLIGKNRGGPGTGGYLFTDRADYADFHLRCEARLSRGQNALVSFRSTLGRLTAEDKLHYTANIAGTEIPTDRSDKNAATTGNLAIQAGGPTWQLLAEAASVPIKVGEWFKFEVVAKGPRIQVFVKEQKVVDYVDAEKTFSTGSIGFGCRPGSTVVFRKIEIKELTPQSASTQSFTDPDRRAAAAVLALGGGITVRVNGQDRRVEPGKELPTEPFRLIQVGLGGKSALTDRDLEPLRDLTDVDAIDLTDAKQITDAALGYLQNLRLKVLNLNGTRVSDAGFMHIKDLSQLEFFCAEYVPLTDRTISRLSRLTKLRVLDAGGWSVTDAGLAHLEQLVNLETLNLGETGNAVTDAGLKHLRNLRRLKYLNLNGTRVTGAGLASLLEELPQLETLGLSRTRVRGSGLVHLQKLVRLKALHLGNLPLRDGDLVHIRSLEALQSLSLDGTRVSGSGLANLKAMSQLRDLDLNSSRMTNSGLEQLKSHSQLEKLHLRGTHVTDAGLHHLEGMTNLDELDLTDTKVTAAGVEKLQKSIPACRILATPKSP